MKFYAGFLLALSLQAQITVSFSPGVKLTRGIYRWSATACSLQAGSLDSGWIYQAAEASGIPLLSVSEANRLATQVRNRNPLVITMNGLLLGTQVSAYLTSSGTIAAPPRVTSELLLASGAVALVQNMLKPQLPENYAGNLLSGTVAFTAGGCVQKDIFARTMKNPTNVQTIISCPVVFR